MSPQSLRSVLTLMSLLFAMSALAEMPKPYGMSISLDNAKKAAALAIAEATRNNWSMAVAVVDPSGNLVYYEKMDNTQIGSAKVSIDKARSAALFKRPTKAFQDRLTSGSAGMPILAVEGAVPVEAAFR